MGLVMHGSVGVAICPACDTRWRLAPLPTQRRADLDTSLTPCIKDQTHTMMRTVFILLTSIIGSAPALRTVEHLVSGRFVSMARTLSR